MSDVAPGPPADAFRPRTVAIMLAVGVAGFVGMLLMGAFAPDLRSGRNGGAHALSPAATGYAGIVALARATGHDARIVRDARELDTEDLVVLTPEHGSVDLTDLLVRRRTKPTLIVLPKWLTVADPGHAGWVRRAGLLPAFDPQRTLAPRFALGITRHRSGGRPLAVAPGLPSALAAPAPRPLQIAIAGRGAAGEGVVPLLTDGADGTVAARLGAGPLYVLVDPDLLANAGLRDSARARAALLLLDWLNATGTRGIAFDVTLNGFGRSRSPLRLAFAPPFLPMTIGLACAVALAAWQAAFRFGAPRPRARAIAFGKAALVDNAAALVRSARREGDLGGRYADLIRDRAAAAFAVPARLDRAGTDAYLDRARGGPVRFTALADAAGEAGDAAAMLAAARDLHDWLGDPASMRGRP